MENSIRVTLGLCVKNVESTVREAINSILSQDFPHDRLELIVVEGFSTDNTSSVIKRSLRDADLKYSVFCENDGLGLARQIVVDNARGEYIVWVDGDMILPKDYVRMQVKFMDDNPIVGIAGGKFGFRSRESLVADLENIVYAVDSVCGERGVSRFGYLPGTEGAIYRVEAVRCIGGFDNRIKGAGEDTELAYRVKTSGWELAVSDQVFVESTRKSWRSLWNQYAWYGRGGHFVFHKDSYMTAPWKMTPPAGFVAGLLRCSEAYKLTHRKIVFLLPIHYTFKRMAWLVGYFRGHIGGYGHARAREKQRVRVH